MSPVSAANLKKDLFMYLERAIDGNEVLSVSTQKGSVVILNADKYYEERMTEAERLEELEAIRLSDNDISCGMVYNHEEVFNELRAEAKKLIDGVNA